MRWTRWQGWALLALGVWMAVAPWALGVEHSGYGTTAVVAAAIVAALGIWLMVATRTTWPAWSAVVIGAAVFFTPWAVGFASVATAAWSTWITSLAVAGLGLWATPSDDQALPPPATRTTETSLQEQGERDPVAG